MTINHPHWDVHYMPMDVNITACGKPWREVLHARKLTKGITCPHCLQTEAYKLDLAAQKMENALATPGCSYCKGSGRHPIQETNLTWLCPWCGGSGKAPSK